MQLVGIGALKLQSVVINVVVASAEEIVSLSNFFVDLGSVPVQTVVWNICGAPDVVISGFQFPGSLPPPIGYCFSITRRCTQYPTHSPDALVVWACRCAAGTQIECDTGEQPGAWASHRQDPARRQLPDHPFLHMNNASTT
jgi:hypothetical protein